MTVTVLRSSCQVLYGMPLNWDLCSIFSHGSTGIMGFWKEYHSGKLPFSSYNKGNILSARLVTVDVKLDHLAWFLQVKFVRFPYCQCSGS